MREYFKDMVDDKGNFKLDALSQEARKFIGYRIPTEGHVSMFAMEIVGFLPPAAANIALPQAITTIAGLDFDIDKMYLMMKVLFAEKEIDGQKVTLEKSDKELVKDAYFTPVEYQYNMNPKDMTDAQLTNALIDLSFTVLSSSKAGADMLNPGGFRTMKKVKKMLDNLNEKDDTNMNLFLPSTQIYLHNMNADAASLVGLFANHNAAHATAQHFDFLELNDEHKHKNGTTYFKLNGKRLKYLDSGKPTLKNHPLKKGEDPYWHPSKKLHRNVAEPQIASVDAVKDPVFFSFNINRNTANVFATLSRLGYDIEELGLLLNQPVIKEFSTRMIRRAKPNKWMIIENILKEKLNEVKEIEGEEQITKGDQY